MHINNSTVIYSLRQHLGAIAYDLPRFVRAMRLSRVNRLGAAPWVNYCNRNERLTVGPDGLGVACGWQWTSDLHIAKVFPALGLRLMKRALADWPITLQSEPELQTAPPDVSFIIGHRGQARLPHLLLTLQSLAAQRGVTFECIVVEQSIKSEIQSALPDWVRYVHTPLPQAEMPYCRSWTFNVGARAAQGNLLVLHDNDMLVPNQYAAELFARYEEGYEVINLKRFVFYLSEAHTEKVFSADAPLSALASEAVVQNLEAGGSFAIAREAYFAIGGFDESFVGWGGEDNEFWERASTRCLWPYGYLPIVHLWHPPQKEKTQSERAMAKQRYWQLAKINPDERIKKLRESSRGTDEEVVNFDLIVTK